MPTSTSCEKEFTITVAQPFFAYWKLNETVQPTFGAPAEDEVSDRGLWLSAGVFASVPGKKDKAYNTGIGRYRTDSLAAWDLSATDFTIRFWFNITGSEAWDLTFVQESIAFWQCYNSSSTGLSFACELTDFSVPVVTVGSLVLAAGWHRYMARVRRGVSIGLRIDNNAEITTPALLPVRTNSPTYLDFFGDHDPAGVCYLDEVAIWKRLLTAQEISDDWNSGSGTTYPTI